jgi:hypothetical protein
MMVMISHPKWLLHRYDSFHRNEKKEDKKKEKEMIDWDLNHPNSKYGIIATTATSSSSSSFRRRRRLHPYRDSPVQWMASSSSSSSSLISEVQPNMELTALGTILAGTVEIATSTLTNYVTGYVTGYVIGTIIGIPQSFLRGKSSTSSSSSSSSISVGPNGIPKSWFPTQWIQQIHSKSHIQYGRKWGNVSSIFGGCRTLVTVIRRQRPPPSSQQQQQQQLLLLQQSQSKKNVASGTTSWRQQQQQAEQDQWNDIISSLLAGAILARSGTLLHIYS